MPNLVWVDAAEKERRSNETAQRYARLMAQLSRNSADGYMPVAHPPNPGRSRTNNDVNMQPPRPFGTALAALPSVSLPAGEHGVALLLMADEALTEGARAAQGAGDRRWTDGGQDAHRRRWTRRWPQRGQATFAASCPTSSSRMAVIAR